jgi:hypothetical protein
MTPQDGVHTALPLAFFPAAERNEVLFANAYTHVYE